MRSRPVVAAIAVGYVLLVIALLRYLPSPWNYAIVGLVSFKATAFWAIVRRASRIGAKGKIPPS